MLHSNDTPTDARGDPQGDTLTTSIDAALDVDLGTKSSVAWSRSGAVSSDAPRCMGTSSLPLHQHATHLQQGIRKPKQFTNGTIHWCMHSQSSTEEPTTIGDAFHDPNWVLAMDVENQALIGNIIWHLVAPLKRKNVISCKQVYKMKRKANGSIDRFKAHLVAKGFKQRYDFDYVDTFNPMVNAATIRLVLTITFSRGWSLSTQCPKCLFAWNIRRRRLYAPTARLR